MSVQRGVRGAIPACIAAGLRVGWYPSMPCRFPFPHPRGKLRGIWPGGCLLQEGACSRGVCSSRCLLWEEGVCSRGVCGVLETPPTPRDGYCCRQYASYWNAFLFTRFSQVCVRARYMCLQVCVQIKKYITRC